MTVPRYSLSPKQRAVLAWVEQGCPNGVYEGFSHRVSARALHHRGMLVVKGHGASWSATLTDEGAAYLHPEHHPKVESFRAAPVLPQKRKHTLATKTLTDQTPPATGNPPPAAQKKKKPGVVDQMMDALQEAHDHRIIIPSEHSNRYQRRAAAAERDGRIPPGMQITVHTSDDKTTAIVAIEPLPAWRTAVLQPITVPTQLRDPTDVTQKLSDSATFAVHGPARNRALRLVDALVTTARSRDWRALAFVNQPVGRNHSYRGGVCRDGVEITLELDIFRLWFTQDMVHTPHEPTPRELSRVRYGYLFPDVDETPDEHLGLVLDGEGKLFWASQWKDTEDHRLEDDLAQVVEEIRLRHEDLIGQRNQERKRFEAQQREQEEELAQARVQYREAFLIEAMSTQAQQWEEAALLRRYAQAVRKQAELVDGERREQAVAWAEKIYAQADILDPLRGGARPPGVREPSPADLQPFLPRGRFSRW